ncbi:primase C-terminal domain-containing protein [Donghicola mangrovi]|uniref:Primase C-terminal 1 domain-containing protein n=1 Tax=Donghicola mangrovi TaxID=2729614 RepID=A0A850Q3N6_9RHOB|nr:primase C-terminal domain-containing protein [Donghicola mangrovi]NVO22632.1 hypothetical protein [Donghicola mangrovi]
MFENVFEKLCDEYAQAAAVQPGRIPDFVWVANSDKKVFRVNKLENNIWTYPYLQANYSDKVNSIIVDVDSIICIEALKSHLPLNMLPASITGKLAPCGAKFIRPHIRFNLKVPVRKKDKAVFERLKSVTQALQLAVQKTGADVDSATPPLITKNPFSSNWDAKFFGDASKVLWELDEFEEMLSVPHRLIRTKGNSNKTNVRSSPLCDEESRNCGLFNAVKSEAYANRTHCQNSQELFDYVHEKCRVHNAKYPRPLSASEVKAVAKSITKWTWNNYKPKNLSSRYVYDKGAARQYIQEEDSIRQRQSVGAYFSHMKRSNDSFGKVYQAVQELRNDGAEVTRNAVIKRSGLTKKTVRKYFEQAREFGPEGFSSRGEEILTQRLSSSPQNLRSHKGT